MDDLWAPEVEMQRRMKDQAFRIQPGSPIPPNERLNWKGLSYYPPDPRYRFVAPLVAEKPRQLEIQRSGGDVSTYTRLGHFLLQVPDGVVQLAMYDSEGNAFLPFRDATSGKETYGAGRYLDPRLEPDGRYLVDFNLAYNPYCAYSDAFSCPFPPPENWLTVPIPVGEKAYDNSPLA